MNQELTVYKNLSGFDVIQKLGEMFAHSGMFGTEKIEQGQVLALACITEQQSPFQLLRRNHLVKGRLVPRADHSLAEYKRAGGKCKWITKLNDCEKAEAHFVFEENDITEAYTIADAKREKLDERDNWKKSTPDMLRSRLVVKVLRMIAPGIACGETEDAEEAPAGAAAVAPDLSKDAASALKPENVIDVEVIAPENAQPAADPNAERKAKLGIAFGGADAAWAVNYFLLKKNWITDTQTYLDVEPDTADLILARPGDFIAKAKEIATADGIAPF